MLASPTSRLHVVIWMKFIEAEAHLLKYWKQDSIYKYTILENGLRTAGWRIRLGIFRFCATLFPVSARPRHGWQTEPIRCYSWCFTETIETIEISGLDGYSQEVAARGQTSSAVWQHTLCCILPSVPWVLVTPANSFSIRAPVGPSLIRWAVHLNGVDAFNVD